MKISRVVTSAFVHLDTMVIHSENVSIWTNVDEILVAQELSARIQKADTRVAVPGGIKATQHQKQDAWISTNAGVRNLRVVKVPSVLTQWEVIIVNAQKVTLEIQLQDVLI